MYASALAAQQMTTFTLRQACGADVHNTVDHVNGGDQHPLTSSIICTDATLVLSGLLRRHRIRSSPGGAAVNQ